MNIPKAIEILRPLDQDAEIVLDPDTYDAIQLGIEALNAWKSSREAGGVLQGYLLPGETEEVK